MKKIDNEKEKTIKATIWYFASNIIVNVISFLGITLFARLLTKSEYGFFNNFLAWKSVFAIIFTLSVSSTLVKARFDFENELFSYIGTNILLSMLVTIFFFLIFILNSSFWGELTSIDYFSFILLFGSILFVTSYEMFQQIMRFRYQYKIVVAINIVLALSEMVISFALLFKIKNGYRARILGSQVPITICSIVCFIFLISKIKRIKIGYCTYALRLVPGYVMHLLAGIILYSSDRVIITFFCGSEDNALYSMGCNIAIIANAAWEAMNSAYSPWLGNMLEKKDYSSIKSYAHKYIFIYLFCIIGLMLIAPEALRFLGGGEYLAAKYVVPPIMLSYFFLFIYSMYVNIEQYHNKTGYMAFATFVAAVGNCVLNYFFIPKWGYMAAAYTTLIGYIFLMAFHIVVVRCLKYEKIYNLKYIILVSMCACVITLVCAFAYKNNWVRYGLILLYIVLCFVLFKSKYNAIVHYIKNRE